MGDPEDASDATGNLETTVIYYDPAQAAAQAVAESVNTAMGGGATVLPLQGTPPTADGDIAGAGVLRDARPRQGEQDARRAQPVDGRHGTGRRRDQPAAHHADDLNSDAVHVRVCGHVRADKP